jgi:hypothetical protein
LCSVSTSLRVKPTISVRKVKVARPTWPAATMALTRSGQLSCVACGSGRLVERDAPERGAERSCAEHAGRADAVADYVHWAALFTGQCGSNGSDIGIFTAQLIIVGVATRATAAPVHGGYPPLPGQRTPHTLPALDSAHAAVHQQQPRPGPSSQQADADTVGAGDPVPGIRQSRRDRRSVIGPAASA